ncbi:MAG: 4Fe-4S dicluster domain-containing protein [Desulfosoma sp.]
MALVDLSFSEVLERFGAPKTLECFHCGTCAAICPLLDEHFPRRVIRYAQIGAADRLLASSTELWRCLHCGLCAQTKELNHGERSSTSSPTRGMIRNG